MSNIETKIPDEFIDRVVAFLRGIDSDNGVLVEYVAPPPPPSTTRTHTDDGRQLVVVNGRKNSKMSGLTYAAPDGFLVVGDFVELPATAGYMHPYRTWEGKVTSLETNYMGEVKNVIRRLPSS